MHIFFKKSKGDRENDMPMNELQPTRTPNEQMQHTVSLEDRRHLRVGGITDVIGYDEHSVTAHTTRGILTVEGDGLHVRKISLEEGMLLLDGTVTALYYTEEAPAHTGGFWERLFR